MPTLRESLLTNKYSGISDTLADYTQEGLTWESRSQEWEAWERSTRRPRRHLQRRGPNAANRESEQDASMSYAYSLGSASVY